MLIGIDAIPFVANGLQQFLEDRTDADYEFGSGFWKFFYRLCRMGYATLSFSNSGSVLTDLRCKRRIKFFTALNQ